MNRETPTGWWHEAAFVDGLKSFVRQSFRARSGAKSLHG